MTVKRFSVIAALALSLSATALFSAGGKATFKARLSAVPADARTRAALAGSGSATATLDGDSISVVGSFDGLLSNVTTAELHAAVAAGVRGPKIADLTVEKTMTGKITGTVKLTEPQMVNLEHNGLYLELHSEKAPEGVLWGWFIKQ